MTERTLSIIKPDAVTNGATGKILARIEEAGFKVLGLRMIQLNRFHAEGFYAVHRERPFFGELTEFMSSGPCIVMVLDKENAISDLRLLMGATDPANADEGTIRKEFGEDVERNAIHGSDSPESAAAEISYFFTGLQIRPA